MIKLVSLGLRNSPLYSTFTEKRMQHYTEEKALEQMMGVATQHGI